MSGQKPVPKRVSLIRQAGKNSRSRTELNNMILADLVEAWEFYGIQALKAMAKDEPGKFVQAYAALLPKQVSVDITENMDEEQLVARIRELAANLGLEADLKLLDPPRPGTTSH
jgi:hypothetical protein